jgi:hypothetical protein
VSVIQTVSFGEMTYNLGRMPPAEPQSRHDDATRSALLPCTFVSLVALFAFAVFIPLCFSTHAALPLRSRRHRDVVGHPAAARIT